MVRAVGRGREEVAGFGLRPEEEGAKGTEVLVNII